jgi:hypothetical protein
LSLPTFDMILSSRGQGGATPRDAAEPVPHAL